MKFVLLAVLFFPQMLLADSCGGEQALELVHQSGCLQKFSEAMHGANGVGKMDFTERREGGMIIRTYIVPTLFRSYMPSSDVTPVADLVIEWKTPIDSKLPPDAPPHWMKSCAIRSAGNGATSSASRVQ